VIRFFPRHADARFLARFRRPTAAESLSLVSPRESNQREGDPDEAPSLREGTRRGCGVSRRYIPVPTRNSRTSCARPFGLILRPAAASYGTQDQEQWQEQRQEPPRHFTRRLASCADKNWARMTIVTRWDPARAVDLAVDLDRALALWSRRWRRAAQPDGGERRDCLRPWMAEFRVGRRLASSAGNRSGSIGSAPASGRLSFGYFSLAKQRKVTRRPKAVETEREILLLGRIPTSHREHSHQTPVAGERMNTHVRPSRASRNVESTQTRTYVTRPRPAGQTSPLRSPDPR
jgi:hypothetical protein